MKQLKLIEDKIAFEFLEKTSSRGFSNETESGLIVQESEKNQLDRARWGKVLSCSPNVTEVEESQFILIEPMGWTPGIELDEVEEDVFWITTEGRIMAVSDTEPDLI